MNVYWTSKWTKQTRHNPSVQIGLNRTSVLDLRWTSCVLTGRPKDPSQKPVGRQLDAHDESKWKCRENLIDTVFSQIKSSTSFCREHLLQRAGIVDTGTDRKQYSLWEILTKDNRVRSYSYTFSNTERRVYSTVASQ